ncbi:ABC transporter substrate-binding protein [Lysinibacillus sp. CNPSo 3705]|uniref:ABC transporter substrate-binding protein n=1 Tax=Lysinibacillus sp. CNPSo 3705 TaxID=3028148 RepID=UPI0023636B9C|nr:ABC transporter substrate-binding protein [Lysinibacillus sp. CNPSo 3705]MDD1502954.1 ABC transporter substrate-binding protein [Lysinibacillus sp. CNPSo 3705]
MKKWYLPVTLALLTAVLGACGNEESTTSNSTTKVVEEQRIGSLSIHLTNDLIALDITPVGSVVGGSLGDFLPQAAPYLTEATKYGPAKDVDMESLLSSEPDVIVADEEFAAANLEHYKKIAPVQLYNLDEGTWRDHLTLLGEKFKKEELAKQFIADYEKKTEEVKSLLAKQYGEDATAMAIRVTDKELRVFSTARPMGPILFKDLNLEPATGITEMGTEEPYQVISKEVIGDYDADIIFVVVNSNEEAEKVYKELTKSSIWKSLKAVQKGQIFVVSDQPWLDYSALGNSMAMDQLYDQLKK